VATSRQLKEANPDLRLGIQGFLDGLIVLSPVPLLSFPTRMLILSPGFSLCVYNFLFPLRTVISAVWPLSTSIMNGFGLGFAIVDLSFELC